jgi:hypothetical protein
VWPNKFAKILMTCNMTMKMEIKMQIRMKMKMRMRMKMKTSSIDYKKRIDIII